MKERQPGLAPINPTRGDKRPPRKFCPPVPPACYLATPVRLSVVSSPLCGPLSKTERWPSRCGPRCGLKAGTLSTAFRLDNPQEARRAGSRSCGWHDIIMQMIIRRLTEASQSPELNCHRAGDTSVVVAPAVTVTFTRVTAIPRDETSKVRLIYLDQVG